MSDRLFTGGTRVLLNTLALFAVILWLTHMLSCAWVAIGSFYGGTDASWIRAYSVVGTPFLYTTAFHWALAQLTLGSSEVNATNTAERLMNIVMLLLGLVLSSTFVSALSATLVGYQMQSSAVNDQMRLLRKFLRKRNVPSLVAFRVTKQAQHRIQQQVAIREDAVTILDTLSPSLLSELRESMYRSAVLTHPLFVLWESFSTSTFQGLTDMCDFQFCGPGDDVFLAGTRCFRVVFLMKGALTYAQYPDSSVVAFTTNRPVEPDTWFCEAAIWCDWIHVGGAATTESSQLLVVEASRVVEVATKHRIISDVTREYCRQFHNCVIHARPPNPLPDDLSVPSRDCADIIHSMPLQR